MKSQRWMTTLIGLAMLGIIGVLVVVGGVFFWRNSNLRELAVDGPVAEVTGTVTDEGSDSSSQDDTPSSVSGDSEESTPTGRTPSNTPDSDAAPSPTPNPTAKPTSTMPPTVTPIPSAANTSVPVVPTNTTVPVIPTETTVPPTDPSPVVGGGDFTSYDDNNAMMNLINQERCGQGLFPVTYNGLLYNTALQHSVDMLQNDFFDHTGSNGSTVAERASGQGYAWLTIGENIAAGQTNPNEIFTDWMNSPGHRDNILKPEFREMGLAHIYRGGSTWGHYWTLVLGSTGSNPISCADVGY